MSSTTADSAPAEEIDERDGVALDPSPFPPLEPIPEERPAEKVTPVSAAVAVIAVPVAALIVGGVWHFIGYNLFDMLIISAVFAGVGAGCLAGLALVKSGARNQNFDAWCGIIAAVLTVLSRYTWDAHATRPAMVAGGVAYLSAQEPRVSEEEVRARVEYSLNPWVTLKWYMLGQADEGVTIGRAQAGVTSDKPLRLKGFFFWALIALETGAMALAGGVAAVGMTTNRYCAECGKPLKENLLFRRHSDQTDDVLALAGRQDWHGLMSLPKAERSDPKNMADVILHRCEAGGCPATLSVEKQTASVPRKKLLNAWISPESANAAREASIAEPI